ncbi:MAG: LON peptidase substrate-binding domain-containing protein [Methylocystis sp.]
MCMNRPYVSIDELPDVLRLFPLEGALLLPRGDLPLNIFEPRYLSMIDSAMAGDRLIGMVQPLPDARAEEVPLYEIGCAGRLTHFSETGDGRYVITLSGVSRFRILDEAASNAPFRTARVAFEAFAHDLEPGAGEDAVDRAGMTDMLRKFAHASKLDIDWASIDAAPTEILVNALAMMCPFGAREKQSLLEAIDLKRRAEVLVGLARFDLAQGESVPRPVGRGQFH